MRALWLGILLCFVSGLIILFFATEEMIDQREILVGSSVFDVLTNHIIQLLWAFLLIVIIHLLTRRREVPNLSDRAPKRSITLQEVLLFVGYGALVLFGGHLIAKLFGMQSLGMHLHGSFYGSAHAITPFEIFYWAGYNFLFYVIIPYLYTRSKKYTLEALNLKSLNRRKDLVLIVVILAIEAIGQLSIQSHIFELSLSEFILWGSISFVIHMFGTVLPAMFFIYCFLINRYYRLTGSAIATVLLGGLTYAAFHLTEYWTSYATFEASIVSISFVILQFIGPGIVKSYLTIRTGNAWVHAWSYHAIAPHVIVDTPHIMHYFRH